MHRNCCHFIKLSRWKPPRLTVNIKTYVSVRNGGTALLDVDSYVKLRSHCRSGHLDRPDRSNSPSKLSSTDHCLVGLVHDLFPTKSAGVRSSSDRVAVELIGYRYKSVILTTLDLYAIISRWTRPLLNQYRSLPDRFSSACLLDRYSTFLTVKNNSPIDADHPDHLPDRLPIAWSGLIELIWSAVHGNPP